MNLIMQSKQLLCQTTIALAAAIAGLQAQAETLTVRYTKLDGTSHTRLVEEDIRIMDFGSSGLASITLPQGLTRLEWLNLWDNRLTSE